jgi:hypothetical protein
MIRSTYTAYMPASIVDAEGFIRQGDLHCTPIECLHCSRNARRPEPQAISSDRSGDDCLPVRRGHIQSDYWTEKSKAEPRTLPLTPT